MYFLIIALAAIGCILMMACDNNSAPNHGSATITLSQGDAPNKVILTLSNGEWRERTSTWSLWRSIFDLTQTSFTAPSGAIWHVGLNELMPTNITEARLPNNSQLELTFHVNSLTPLTGTYIGQLSWASDPNFFNLFSTLTNLSPLATGSALGGPLTITVQGTDTRP